MTHHATLLHFQTCNVLRSSNKFDPNTHGDRPFVWENPRKSDKIQTSKLEFPLFFFLFFKPKTPENFKSKLGDSFPLY